MNKKSLRLCILVKNAYTIYKMYNIIRSYKSARFALFLYFYKTASFISLEIILSFYQFHIMKS